MYGCKIVCGNWKCTLMEEGLMMECEHGMVLPYVGINESRILQVNEKSCRLRMGAYRDRVKRKGDKIVMGL